MASSSRNSGRTFTLLEVSILLFLVAAVALFALPRWQSDRIRDNQVAAVSLLRRLAQAQDAFRQRNGGRSYGFLEELAGSDLGRQLTTWPPTLADLWPEQGVFKTSGFCVLVYLSDASGRAVHHPAAAPGFEAIADFYVAYAWPASQGVSGHDIYGMLRDGRIFAAENTLSLSGTTDLPPANLLGPMLEPGPIPAPRTLRLRWRELPPGAAY